MNATYQQIDWPSAEPDCRELVRLALEEDLHGVRDLTTCSLVPKDRVGAADFVARESGVVCGLPVGDLVRELSGGSFDWQPRVNEGNRIAAGDCLATVTGPARELLTCERTILNFLGRLSGIASTTRQYVDRLQGSRAKVYDTRKTTPGWRRLEKYAVATGGGQNHRTGLYDAVLIKDNHLAFAAEFDLGVAEAVRRARVEVGDQTVVEIEVDTLEQLREALPARPDVVLLDNMSLEKLRQAVALRDQSASAVQLEASGGVTLDALASIGETGVDRISVGALTHSARSLDIGLDWRP